MSHTPGPWKFHAPSGIVFTDKTGNIAYLPSSQEHNAHLIRSAPELLEALEQIIGDLPSRRDWLDPEVENVAREAIRKARGAE